MSNPKKRILPAKKDDEKKALIKRQKEIKEAQLRQADKMFKKSGACL